MAKGALDGWEGRELFSGGRGRGGGSQGHRAQNRLQLPVVVGGGWWWWLVVVAGGRKK